MRVERLATATRPTDTEDVGLRLQLEQARTENAELRRRLAAVAPEQETELLPLNEAGYEALLSKVHRRLALLTQGVRHQSEANNRNNRAHVGAKGRDALDQVFRLTENLEREMTAEASLLACMRQQREKEEECTRLKRQVAKLRSDKAHLIKMVEAEKETKKAYKQQLEDKTNQVVQLMTSNTKLVREHERLKTSLDLLGDTNNSEQGNDAVKRMLLVQLRNAEQQKAYADFSAKQIKVWENRMRAMELEVKKRMFTQDAKSEEEKSQNEEENKVGNYNFIMEKPTDAKVRDWMKYLAATEGYFPHYYLNDLSTPEANECLLVLCREFHGYHAECLRIQHCAKIFCSPSYLRDAPASSAPVIWSRVVAQAASLVQCERTSLWIVDSTEENVWTILTIPPAPLEGRNVPTYTVQVMPLKGFLKVAVKDREGVHVDDAYKDPRFDRETDEAKVAEGEVRAQSVLTEPIIFGNQVVAVVEMINKCSVASTVFSPTDRVMLRSIAPMLYTTIRLARTSATQRMVEKRQKLVLQFGDDLLKHANERPAAVLRLLSERVRELFCAKRVTLTLTMNDGFARCAFDETDDDAPPKLLSAPKQNGLVGYQAGMHSKEPLVVHQARRDFRFSERIDVAAEGLDMVVVAPVFHRTGPIEAVHSATLSWSSRQGPDGALPLVVDDGLYQPGNPQHDAVLQSLLERIDMFLEHWQPSADRVGEDAAVEAADFERASAQARSPKARTVQKAMTEDGDRVEEFGSTTALFMAGAQPGEDDDLLSPASARSPGDRKARGSIVSFAMDAPAPPIPSEADDPEMAAAATKLQAVQRGKAGRRVSEAKRMEKTEKLAAAAAAAAEALDAELDAPDEAALDAAMASEAAPDADAAAQDAAATKLQALQRGKAGRRASEAKRAEKSGAAE